MHRGDVVGARAAGASLPEPPDPPDRPVPAGRVTGGTPAAVVARLEAELRRILSDHELIAAFEKPGMTASFTGAREFARFLDEEINRWAVAVKYSGAQAD